MVSPIGWQADFDGYQAIVFLHEHGIFSVLLVWPTADPALSQLRHEAAFMAACRAIPGLADWVDPSRARPITPVFPGGPLLNAYRGQTGHDGQLALPGLVFVGDAVATTTPTFGRGYDSTTDAAGPATAAAGGRARHRHGRGRPQLRRLVRPARSSRGSTITSRWTRRPGAGGRGWRWI